LVQGDQEHGCERSTREQDQLGAMGILGVVIVLDLDLFLQLCAIGVANNVRVGHGLRLGIGAGFRAGVYCFLVVEGHDGSKQWVIWRRESIISISSLDAGGSI